MPHQEDKIKLVVGSGANDTRQDESHRQYHRLDTRHLSLESNPNGEQHYLFNKYSLVTSEKDSICRCKQSVLPNIRPSQRVAMEGKFIEKYANIRFIGFLLFVIASVFCLYKIYELNQSDESTNRFPAIYSTKLKLVSVFNRHGDRAPSDKLPDNDNHKEASNSFWPNGLSNLTDSGRFREYRIGVELRRRYDRLLDFNSSHFAVFSSPIYRCQESASETLRGLFDVENTVKWGRNLAERYNAERGLADSFCFKDDDLVQNETFCKEQGAKSRPLKGEKGKFVLPAGSGFPREYTKVKIDLSAVPTLTWQYLSECKWRLENPTPVDDNLLNSMAVAQLKGINKLVKLIKSRYNLDFNFTALGHWSSISNEILLSRTKDTIKYSGHYLDWLNTALPEYKRDKVTLYDLWEQAAVLAYRDRVAGTAHYIQYGPIISSLLKSQSVALNHLQPERSSESSNASGHSRVGREKDLANQLGVDSSAGTFADSELYRDKRMIIYSTHDSILQQLMMNLSLIHFEPEDFESRFHKWRKADDVSQLLAGYKMSKFGMSLALELYETEFKAKKKSDGSLENQIPTVAVGKKFPFIQAVLYNQGDGKFKPVEYKRLKLGAACREKFKTLNQHLSKSEFETMLGNYYDSEFPLDKDLSCPFELFKRVLGAYSMTPHELNKLCKS